MSTSRSKQHKQHTSRSKHHTTNSTKKRQTTEKHDSDKEKNQPYVLRDIKAFVSILHGRKSLAKSPSLPLDTIKWEFIPKDGCDIEHDRHLITIETEMGFHEWTVSRGKNTVRQVQIRIKLPQRKGKMNRLIYDYTEDNHSSDHVWTYEFTSSNKKKKKEISWTTAWEKTNFAKLKSYESVDVLSCLQLLTKYIDPKEQEFIALAEAK